MANVLALQALDSTAVVDGDIDNPLSWFSDWPCCC